jgi:glycosyltransferase involved in cell wall biosynthesis
MICYSYYWKGVAEARASGKYNSPTIVFQVHPISTQIKRVLRDDRAKTGLTYSPEPEEEVTPEQDNSYINSLQYADGIITASSFTAQGLIEAGVSPTKIFVSPYGIGFTPEIDIQINDEPRWHDQYPLRLLWVGQLAYRKAPHHLFDAVRHFTPEQVQVSIVSRNKITAELASLIPPNVQIYTSIDDRERQEMYRNHHLFVMPSLVEGFGLVFGEALAEGLPILCTTNTGGPDIIQNGIEGFVVPAGDPEAIINVIDTCLLDKTILISMACASRKAANRWSWTNFRHSIRTHLAKIEEIHHGYNNTK